jgi:hypothetical protein
MRQALSRILLSTAPAGSGLVLANAEVSQSDRGRLAAAGAMLQPRRMRLAEERTFLRNVEPAAEK